jgi:hypothetical protein
MNDLKEMAKDIALGLYKSPRSERSDPLADTSIALIGSMSGNISTGEQVEALCQCLAMLTGEATDWHVFAGRYVVKTTMQGYEPTEKALLQLLPEVLSELPAPSYEGFPKIQISWLSRDGSLLNPVV